MQRPFGWETSKPSIRSRLVLQHLFDEAVAAVDPLNVVPPHLPPAPKGRTIVLGAGKASARMALAVERNWSAPLEGLVVTRYGHGEPCSRIEVVEAGHPVPDKEGYEAAKRMLALTSGLTENDQVIFLMSGGGSSLLSLPAPGISLLEKRDINSQLLRCGATINEINGVRRYISAVKGGRLALACYPAKVLTLVISDVPGDDPTVVASGPSVPSDAKSEEALRTLDKYAIEVSDRVRSIVSDMTLAPPQPNDERLRRNHTVVVATAQSALDAAVHAAKNCGYQPVVLGNSIEGEARSIATMHAGIARQVVLHNQPFPKQCVLLSGGETTVTVRGNGRGGRNAEFLLSLAIALNGLNGVHALACDTDGIDGTEDNAGAFVSPDSLSRAAAFGLNPQAMLESNDGYSFFAALNDLVKTGPTRTNVNDFRAILIEG
ncbi:glycerate kinase [Herbaspirillum sp. GCM10030257]|uniref:glycerate kinase type-2 family protein n=1 Tax=Herbaspirillum sp. GCM10030257 TaxID=3273393 RepID=UPI00361CE086